MTVIALSKLPTRQHSTLADAAALQEVMSVLCLSDVTIVANIEIEPVLQHRLRHFTIASASFDDVRLAEYGGLSYLLDVMQSKFGHDDLAFESLDELKHFVASEDFLKGDPYQFMFCDLEKVLAFNDNRMLVSFFEISQKIIDAMPEPVSH